MQTSTILFDADGVLTLPEETFSVMYTRSHGLNAEPFEQFFASDWPAIVTGKQDLKQAISANPDLWQWKGSVDDLLTYWFETENVRNEELIALIRRLQEQGTRCYLATDQEKYRAEYMKEHMFKDLFHGYFISSTIGYTKSNPKFFEAVIDLLCLDYPGIEPQQIVFFDDSQTKVDTACSVGINGQLYESVDQVRAFLSASSI